MKRYVLVFFMIMLMSAIHAQTLPILKPKSTGENTSMLCHYVDENGKEHWVKTVKSLNKKQISKIQQQLLFLDYSVIKTGVLDVQTKRELALFNKDNALGNYPYVLPDTQSVLKAKYKEKKKAVKK
ncbi:hypothetical protein KO494_09360 [Lacinutrix sp. C3R15]|uniref:hypothetical protein n=1 Tax=Flavobacteriaceae TaxID=49546 RepID=UPI001C0988C9|nr:MULTISPECIES: hypothetical protein [Flavobacteriaceae]MBU2939744.1 hypothetical protein [Lacinutrix sp. C3R15]MDO6623059.1 hypothetical protein [Oceanihabitans sp. 1_MG-2023]